MSRPRTTGSVSLFPFLAVLVCAMGALIFLLVVTTRQIRTEAVARARDERARSAEPVEPQVPVEPLESEPPPLLPELAAEPPVDPNIELRSQLVRLDDETAAARAELARRKAAVQAIHENSRRLAADAGELESRIAEVAEERRNQAEAISLLVGHQRAIEGEIQGLSGRIAEVRQRAAQASNRFAFVPYDGRLGTARRPIHIECTERGLRFVPEDVAITEQDLEGFLVEFNPLQAGADALADFWERRDLLAGGAVREPYFLLIVRPGGARAFYVAQKILGREPDRFGYELLTDDFPLALPEVDPQAREICRRAVEELVAERDQLLASLRREGGASSRGATVIRGGAGGGVSRGVGGSGGGSRDRFGGPGDRPTFDPQSLAGGDSRGAGGDARRPGPSVAGEGFGERELEGEPHANGATASGGTGMFGESPRLPPDFRPSAFEDGSAQIQPDRSATRDHSGRFGADGALPRTATRRSAGAWSPDSVDRMDTADSRRIAPPRDSAQQASDAVQAGGARGIQPATPGGSNGRPGEPGVGIPTFGGNRESSENDRELSPRWGASARRGTIGLEKEVLVEVLPDRLIVGRELLVPADPDESIQTIADELVEAMERHVARWGEPPATFYWSPRVRFRVGQGANRQYERIRGPVARLGLSTAVDFVLETEQGGTR
ncbi:MAG: hypothetical protein WD066_04635 [Planctomycetaceae bacterium]